MTRRSRDAAVQRCVHENSLKRRAARSARPPRRNFGARQDSSSLDHRGEAGVARQGEQIIDPVGLAPGHQGFASEARIGERQQDGRTLGQLTRSRVTMRAIILHRSGACVDVGFAKLRRQEMTAAEHVERQIAVAVVIAVEKAALLMAVQRVVGGVEIENDLLGRAAMRLQEQVDQQRLDHRLVVADLVIAGRKRPADGSSRFSVDLPSHRRGNPHLRASKACRRGSPSPVMAQLIVIDQVLIAERQSEHPLADQRLDLVLDQLLAARVPKAGGKPTR